MFEINATKKSRCLFYSFIHYLDLRLGITCAVSTTYSHYNNTIIYNICQIKKKRTSGIDRRSHLKFLERRTVVVLLEDRAGFEPTIIDLQSIALNQTWLPVH